MAETGLASPSDAEVEWCSECCNDGRAQAFKDGLPTMRVRVQVAPSDTSKRNMWVAYQTEKCGPLEYNIYDPNWVVSAIQYIGYELDPRSSIWADGLAATEPPAAPQRYKFGCCLLEAKYSQPDTSQALYVARRIFVRTRDRKWWLRLAYQRYKDGQAIKGFLGRRFGRRPRPVKSFARYAGDKWRQKQLVAIAQLAAYAVFCRNRDTPYNIFVVICGEKRFVKTYFNHITPGPGLVAHSPLGGAHWRT